MERKTGRERGPCPEQLKPPGQPGETDSQHHRLQGASSSGKPSSDPSESCGPVGEEVLVDVLVGGLGGSGGGVSKLNLF